MKISLWATLAATILLTACKDDEIVFPDSGSPLVPIVFVHGYFGNGDSYELQALRFSSNGYPDDRLYTFDWNSLGDVENTRKLEEFIDAVRERTGADKVNLVGHSLGGGLVFNYCKDDFNASKVAHLVLLAPYLEDRTALPSDEVSTLNIWSTADRVVTDGSPFSGAENVVLDGIDHNEVASCVESFIAMYSFFNISAAQTTEVIPQDDIVISGKSYSFVENLPGWGASIEVYEVDPATGLRKAALPEQTFTVSQNNEWGPMTAKPGAYYEFKVFTSKSGDRPLHYYREPFTRSNKFVYLRTYPPSRSILQMGLSILPSNSNETVAIFYNTPRTVRLGRDMLSINGVSLDKEDLTGAEESTAAIFLYDENNNNQSDYTPINLFAEQTLKGADVYFPAQPLSTITFELNGRILRAPSWPSKEEGAIVAVFN